MNCKVWLKCCCGGAAITKLSVSTGLLEYRNLAFKERKILYGCPFVSFGA